MSTDPGLAVDVARLVLALVAFGVLVELVILGWLDRRTERTFAQAALVLSLALIVGDSIVRVAAGDPLVLHLFGARVAITLLAGAYAVRRLAAFARENAHRGRDDA